MNSLQCVMNSTAPQWVKFGVKTSIVLLVAHQLHSCFTKNYEKIDFRNDFKVLRNFMYEVPALGFVVWGACSVMRDFEKL